MTRLALAGNAAAFSARADRLRRGEALRGRRELFGLEQLRQAMRPEPDAAIAEKPAARRSAPDLGRAVERAWQFIVGTSLQEDVKNGTGTSRRRVH